jgi:hypothetical protein
MLVARLGSLALVLLGVACASAPPRAKRVLGDLDGLLYSNGLMFDREHEPVRIGSQYEIKYDVSLENHGSRRADIDLQKAYTHFASATQAADCRAFGTLGTSLQLEPGKAARLACRIELSSVPEWPAMGDAHELWLVLPIQKNGLLKALVFPYRLEREDF